MSNSSIKRLYLCISYQRRFQFKLLLVVTVLASFAEIVSLGAVVPFIAVITQPEKIFYYPFMSELASTLGITAPRELVAPIALLFVIAGVLAGVLRIIVLNASIRISNSTGADLSAEMYHRTLHQPYLVHISRNSSDIVSGITQKVLTATSVLAAIITVITSLILFVAVFVALLLIDPMIAGAALSAFGSIYIAISLASKKILSDNSLIIAKQQTNVVRAAQEGLGAIRNVLLDKRQDYYGQSYLYCIQKLQRALGTNQFITLAPRYVMEALALVMIGLFAFFVSDNSTVINSAMPTLGALALGAQRLLPILQQLYGNFSLITGSQQSLIDVLELLEQPVLDQNTIDTTTPIVFQKDIKFDQLSYSYSTEGPPVLSDLNIRIPKGTMVGFVGETGSGKSTAIDLVLGLLRPKDGRLLIDDIEINGSNMASWQNMIAHVPQHIYLSDASIVENIAFGVPHDDIDYEKVHRAGLQAQMSQFVNKLTGGYETIVGERGVKFSGGQRQRIGLARALYKDASVLVLDEATSALDSKTENLVMEAVSALDTHLTVIIIAHRIKTLEKCEKIFEFSADGVLNTISYQALVNRENIKLGKAPRTGI